jgi:hypothetical protein
MIINSLFIGLAKKALPSVNVYSINYKWDLTPHGFPYELIYPSRSHINNFQSLINQIQNFMQINQNQFLQNIFFG